MYSTRLGFHIRKITPYSFEFSFKYIIPEDSEHRIVLYLDSNNQYTIRECIPSLSNILFLLDSLNSTNDIPTFIISLRKSFKELYRIISPSLTLSPY